MYRPASLDRSFDRGGPREPSSGCLKLSPHGSGERLEKKFELAKAKTADGTGTSYPAGIAVAPNGKFVYVAENVGDRLAVVSAATGEMVQRFPTDHYPYGVARTPDGQLFVSAWGSTTISEFYVLARDIASGPQ
jgi:DNA-binding beta-propeller fold protein YncE